jgi:hypothetical protein
MKSKGGSLTFFNEKAKGGVLLSSMKKQRGEYCLFKREREPEEAVFVTMYLREEPLAAMS